MVGYRQDTGRRVGPPTVCRALEFLVRQGRVTRIESPSLPARIRSGRTSSCFSSAGSVATPPSGRMRRWSGCWRPKPPGSATGSRSSWWRAPAGAVQPGAGSGGPPVRAILRGNATAQRPRTTGPAGSGTGRQPAVGEASRILAGRVAPGVHPGFARGSPEGRVSAIRAGHGSGCGKLAARSTHSRWRSVGRRGRLRHMRWRGGGRTPPGCAPRCDRAGGPD